MSGHDVSPPSTNVAETSQPLQFLGAHGLGGLGVGLDARRPRHLAPTRDQLGQSCDDVRMIGRDVPLVQRILVVIEQLELGQAGRAGGVLNQLPVRVNDGDRLLDSGPQRTSLVWGPVPKWRAGASIPARTRATRIRQPTSGRQERPQRLSLQARGVRKAAEVQHRRHDVDALHEIVDDPRGRQARRPPDDERDVGQLAVHASGRARSGRARGTRYRGRSSGRPASSRRAPCGGVARRAGPFPHPCREWTRRTSRSPAPRSVPDRTPP